MVDLKYFFFGQIMNWNCLYHQDIEQGIKRKVKTEEVIDMLTKGYVLSDTGKQVLREVAEIHRRVAQVLF